MEVHYYAQINDDNICDGVSQLSGIVDKPNMIELESYDMSVMGKLWTGSEWVDNPNPPVIEPKPEPVTNEEIKDLLLANMEGMADLYAEQVNTQSLQLDTMQGIADLYALQIAQEGGV